MLLTEAQLHAIRDIIETHHQAFIVNTVGPEAVTADVLKKLKAKGLVNVKVSGIEDAYIYGQILAQMDDPNIAKMSFEEFKAHVTKNPIALTPVEKQALAMAKQQAAQYAVGLGNRVSQATGQLLIEADGKLRARMTQEIRDKTAENAAKRETVKQLKSELGHATKDWARDWDRIAVTEKQDAMQRGLADQIRGKHGPEALVAKRPMPDACKHCKRLHLAPDGHPRIFKLSELERGGSNKGKKADDWEPTVGPVHPHCQCQLIRIPAGWGFNKDGDLVPGATGGYVTGDDDEEVEKSAHRDRLRGGKADRMQPSDFDATALAEGTEHELEHVDDRTVAQEIAMDHLAEDPDYYTKLKRVEKSGMLPPIPMHPKVWPEGKIKHATFQGLDLVIENPRGTLRDWGGGQTLMYADYGFVAGVRGDDGDELDVYVGPRADAAEAYVIAQQNPKDGRYDELKVMLGFGSQEEAEGMYRMHYNRSDFYAYCVPMEMDAFKRWIGVSKEIADDNNGHTAPILAIPLEKAAMRGHAVSAEEASVDSRAGGRSPSPGTAVNYFIPTPPKKTTPMVEGWVEQLNETRDGRDPLKRDKKVYERYTQNPVVAHPMSTDNRTMTIDKIPEEEAEATQAELLQRYRRNVPIKNDVQVEQKADQQEPVVTHKKQPKLVLIKALKGEQMDGHKYTKRVWMNGHWVYTYAEKKGGKVQGHAFDADKVVLKLPKEKAAELQAFKQKHGLQGDIVSGNQYAMLVLTQGEADKLRAATKPATKPAVKVEAKPEHGPAVVLAKDVQRLGDMPLASVDSMDLPKVKKGTLTAGAAVSVHLGGGNAREGKLLGINQEGLPVVQYDGVARRVMKWSDVKADGEHKPKASVQRLEPKALVKASDRQKKLVDQIMAMPALNGKPATEFVTWLRGKGQETYLVGGIVRDMLAGTTPASQATDEQVLDAMKDVDLISTAHPKLGKQMFDTLGGKYNDASQWGVLSASTVKSGLDFATMASGGTDGEPVFDKDLGKPMVAATFDHDLVRDTHRRDFACNALYYDPVNHVIIDPTGNGIADAQNKVLRLCASDESAKDNKKLSLRFWKFRMRGYKGEAESLGKIKQLAAKHLPAINVDQRVKWLGDVVAQKGDTVSGNMKRLRDVMAQDGAADLYDKFIKPHEKYIMQRAIAKRKKAS